MFIKLIIKALFILLFLSVPYIYYQTSVFKLAKVSIGTKKALEGKIKIIQISDYHNNNLVNQKRLIKKIQKIKPDIIVLTGDIIDWKTESFDKTIKFLESLKQINDNVYSVSGNHELQNKKRQEFEGRLKTIGIYDLNYKHQVINIGKVKINLCGIPYYKSSEKKDLNFNDLDEDLFTILLSHSPNKALEYENFKSDLIVSGHIHGGQIRFPLIGALVSPESGFFPKYSKGLYNLDDKKLYIDSGLGSSTIAVRTLNRIQISLIEIK